MKLIKWMMALLCLLALAACGGGGGDSGSPPFPSDPGTGGGGVPPVTKASIEVRVSQTNVTTSAPATVTVTVKDADGKAVSGNVVTITSAPVGVGIFSVGTILTDDDGVATAVLQAGTPGAGEVTATTTVGDEALTGSAGFRVPDGGSGSSPTLAVAISNVTVSPSTGSLVTFTLTDSDGTPLAGQVVTITTSRKLANFSVGTVLTDAKGVATAQLLVDPAGVAGADEIVASVVLDTVTVTGSAAYQVLGGNSPGNAPTTVEVVASSNKVGTAGAPIVITAVVKGTNNVAIAGTPVSFSTDTGTLSEAVTLTDNTGAVTAKFAAGANKSNRAATITVSAGTVSGVIGISIDGSTLTFSGPTTLTLGSSADLSIKAADSQGGAIAGLTVSLTGSLNNIPAGTTLTTDASGAAKLNYKATAAGNDALVIAGGGTTVSPPPVIAVNGQDFAFTAPTPSETINIGDSKTVAVRYRVNGAAPSGAFSVRFTSTAGTFSTSGASTGITMAGGIAQATLSSNFAGPATIQATVFDPSKPSVTVAQATVPVLFVATTPASLELQLSPSAIGPNAAGSTSQQAVVRATVIDAFSNPVAGATVNFSRVSDPSGGNLSQASAVTDANGVASVQYLSGAQSTAADAVVLKATVANKTSVSGTAKLTVNQSALFIALGTGNEITNVNPTTYRKVWTAYVTDATGAAVPNVTLTVSALPTQYRKGSVVWDGKLWSYAKGGQLANSNATAPALVPGLYISCPNEDLQNNGVLDSGEDINKNGRLDPGNVISVNGAAGSTVLKTDASGFALINLDYAESYATWVEISLKVAATVGGTESSTAQVFVVPGLSGDYTVETVPPAGQFSPFGQASACSTAN